MPAIYFNEEIWWSRASEKGKIAHKGWWLNRCTMWQESAQTFLKFEKYVGIMIVCHLTLNVLFFFFNLQFSYFSLKKTKIFYCLLITVLHYLACGMKRTAFFKNLNTKCWPCEQICSLWSSSLIHQSANEATERRWIIIDRRVLCIWITATITAYSIIYACCSRGRAWRVSEMDCRCGVYTACGLCLSSSGSSWRWWSSRDAGIECSARSKRSWKWRCSSCCSNRNRRNGSKWRWWSGSIGSFDLGSWEWSTTTTLRSWGCSGYGLLRWSVLCGR